MGYEPVLIANGLDALTYVRSQPPALILLDIMMSPLSGWEFLELLRAKYNLKEIPVIFLQPHPRFPGNTAELNDPKLGILQKPVTFDELKTALRQFLE